MVEDDTEMWPRYKDSGVAQIIVEVQPDTVDKVLPKLDALAKELARVA